MFVSFRLQIISLHWINKTTYVITINQESGEFTIYHNAEKRIKFVVGDIFDCTPTELGLFDSIWDCNALVAINPEDRVKYTELLYTLLKPNGSILVSTFDYDQSLRNGFPHSVPESLVRSLYEPQGTAVRVVENRTDEPILTRFRGKFNVPEVARVIFHIHKK